jgi:hypothetical protein
MTDKVMTPIFRADFVKLFDSQLSQDKDYREMKTGPKKGQNLPVYGLTMIFEPDTDLADLKRILVQAKEEKWGNKPPSFVATPFRKGVQISDEYPMGFDLGRYPQYEGKIIAPARSTGMPVGVVGPDMDPTTRRPRVITDASEIYSGCFCRATVVAFAYVNEKTGIAFGLQNVQKVRDGEPLGGAKAKAEDDFAAFVEPQAAGFNDDLLGI